MQAFYEIKEEKSNQTYLSTANLNGKKFNCLLKRLHEGVQLEALFALQHGNVARFLDTWKTESETYVVVEPCEHFLFEFVEKQKLSPENTLCLARGVFEALRYAHEKGVFLYGFDLNSLVICGKGNNLQLKFYDFYQQVKDPSYLAPEMSGNTKRHSQDHLNLRDVLKSSSLTDVLLKFCAKNFCEENLEFLKDVKAYKMEPTSEYCEAIKSTYFSGGSRELNVPQSLFEHALHRVDHEYKLFDDLEAFIHRLLEENSMGPFAKSEEYRVWKQKSNPELFLTLEKQDLFSVGVLIYQMVTGMSVNNISDFSSGKEKTGHEIVDKLILSLTQKDPSKRPCIQECLGMIPKDLKYTGPVPKFRCL